jgi:folate-binding protein YgfZ
MLHLAPLPARATLAITGPDRVAFLNGLVSNDVALATPGHAIWAALLSPQGKYLADFFIFAHGETLLLDCEAAQRDMLATKLTRFRLRSAVTITPADHLVYAAWGEGTPPAAEVAAPDPRLPDAGWRLLATAPLTATSTHQDWDAHRLALGLPDGTRDLEIDKTLLLEAGFDELGGISWTKGCYMGQELTARTRYRGLLKRRLLPVTTEGPIPPPGTPILAGAREVGEMRSGAGQRGLALLRLDALAETLGGVRIEMPRWVRIKET